MRIIVSKMDEIFFTLLDDYFWRYVSDRKSLLRLIVRYEIISLSAVQSHLTITLSIYLDNPPFPSRIFFWYTCYFLSSWLRRSLSRRFCSFFSDSQPLLFQNRLISAFRGCCEESISIVSVRIYRDASEETRRRPKVPVPKGVKDAKNRRAVPVRTQYQSCTARAITDRINSINSSLSPKTKKVSLTIIKFQRKQK